MHVSLCAQSVDSMHVSLAKGSGITKKILLTGRLSTGLHRT